MKLHRLELEGFGPFREPQAVDFDAFADDGLFLISGRTGAGKSSVLDGVCFALYGGAPRYEGGEKRLRSDHCAPEDPTRVSLEFSSAGSRWRVTRSPEYDRPKQRGDGLTTEPHRAHLDEWTGGEWIGRAARPVDVANLLDEVLGLSQQQFLQVILLAQNRFAQFLLAKNDDRQKLLRTLFGTRAYEDYARELEARRKASERTIAAGIDLVRLRLEDAERLIGEHELGADASADGIASDPAGDASSDLSGRIAFADRAVQRAAYRAQTLAETRTRADEQHEDAAKAHARLVTLRDMQLDRDRSRVRLAGIEAQAETIAEERNRLDRAARAEALRTTIDIACRALDAVADAEVARSTAIEKWTAEGQPAPGEVAELADLRDRVDRMTQDLGGWIAAVEQERQLNDLESAVAAAHADVSSIEGAVTHIDAQRAGVPGQVAALDAAIAERSIVAAGADSTRGLVDELGRRLAAATEAANLSESARAADVAAVEAGEAMQQASAAVTTLLQRRLAGHAGELAAGLIDGEPCAVCGSIAHPAPAPPSDDPVTDEAVAEAEQHKDAAIAAELEASGAARALRAALATASARAAGAGVAELEQERAAAGVELANATAAATEVERLTAERALVQQTDADAASERDILVERLAVAREAAAATAATARAARAGVDAARGDAASVADRVRETTRLRDLGREVVSAVEEHAARATTTREACADRDARIAESDFADASEATAALLGEADRVALDQRVREHDAALRAAKEKLLELELALADAPAEPIDIESSALALAGLREAWSAAVGAAAEVGHVAAQLAGLVAVARGAHEKFADLADEHAVLARLADTVAGHAPNTHRMTLESFVLAAELEEIVDAANLRLDDMSSGRYRLHHTDARAARNAASGLGLEILDAYTGQARPAQSLSGGETFLASLALALGLAEVVTARAGGVRLDTLFVDEGFGSLDAETLDLAMRTLDELRQGGRTVGVISHVEAMKEQIPAQLVVESTRLGPSVILTPVAT